MLVPSGSALAAPPEAPVEISAARSVGSLKGGEVQLLGAVRIRQGEIEAEGEQARAELRDGEVVRITLTGAPARFAQPLEDGSGTLVATARSIDYRVAERSLLLQGEAVVERGPDRLRAERVEYELDSGRVASDGGAAGRVELKFAPKPRQRPTTP
jgi:lipopolysaccharide export system protein LptA